MAQITLNSTGVASSGALVLQSNGTTTAVTIDTSQNVGIGTASPGTTLDVNGLSTFRNSVRISTSSYLYSYDGGTATTVRSGFLLNGAANQLGLWTNDTERMRITSGGDFLVQKTVASNTTAGISWQVNDYFAAVNTSADSGDRVVLINRQTSDGTLIEFRQANTNEGTISVSGTTVSYNGGHLSRWAQTITPKDESLVKGTVLSNLDEMNVYTDADGNPVNNEQLNKVKVSDVEGDFNVAGVFVNWDHDEDHNVDEINMAMTGDMIIRIAQGVTVARGDLLMSAGDGTAKPQGDDIIRSKTVAKVTSTHVTCTYADGSFCVPCVLMAC
jgi:hypothetical protein